jgi:hypothetical protein
MNVKKLLAAALGVFVVANIVRKARFIRMASGSGGMCVRGHFFKRGKDGTAQGGERSPEPAPTL